MILLVDWRSREIFNSESEADFQCIRSDFENSYSWTSFLQNAVVDYADQLTANPVQTMELLKQKYEDVFLDWLDDNYERVEVN